MTVVFSAEEIQRGISQLSPRILADLGPNFTIVSILTGGFIFTADLVRHLTEIGADPDVDFIQLSSYGAARQSSGEVRWLKSLTVPVEGRTVLLVDDVLESGRSLEAARAVLLKAGAAKIAICVAVNKKVERVNPVEADYSLFETDGSAFLVGYGMDDGALRRGLPYIGAVD